MQLLAAILVLILASLAHARPTFDKIADLLFGAKYSPPVESYPGPGPGPGPLIHEGYQQGYDYHYGGGYGYGGYQQSHPAGYGYYPPRPAPPPSAYYPAPQPGYSPPATYDLYGGGGGYKQRGY
ncbi:protein SRC2 homolog [Drosophila santomea]|uniref:protein SRC2 homolog n=1 Tax=Drosophila santomea TaxID=129105 RepID=UPI001952BE9D|nr:protein SRC2 homolog [Drosophila santomea]